MKKFLALILSCVLMLETAALAFAETASATALSEYCIPCGTEAGEDITTLTPERSAFVQNIAKYVQEYAAVYGYKICSPIIAQAIWESRWGESKLAARYHNYFGIKCGRKWTGKSVNMTTQEEYTAGTITTIKDNFRVYGSMEEGVKGYFEFLTSLSRYDNLKEVTDPLQYLENIKADGYATSSTYVTDVYNIVTTYNLTQYDRQEVQ